jgi:hypothetical protein
LEGLARFINKNIYGGWKSGISGIDLEFDNDNKRYIVNIKSGPNWGNSSQVAKMVADFNSARRSLLTNNSRLNVVAVNGCCYGRDNRPLKTKNYYKFCGQKFWEFISGNTNLYLDVIEPLGLKAKERNDDFMKSYAQMINKFTRQFANDFCNENGSIDWQKLVKFNSAEAKPK